jgi:hypothetical protein
MRRAQQRATEIKRSRRDDSQIRKRKTHSILGVSESVQKPECWKNKTAQVLPARLIGLNDINAEIATALPAEFHARTVD